MRTRFLLAAAITALGVAAAAPAAQAQAQPPAPAGAQPEMPAGAQPAPTGPQTVDPTLQGARPEAAQGEATQCLTDLQTFEREVLENQANRTSPAAGDGSTHAMRQQARSLASAAQMLANYGNEQGCQDVLRTMRQVMRQGPQDTAPGAAETAQAQPPLSQQQPSPQQADGGQGQRQGTTLLLTSRDVIGAEVRNPRNQDLGNIEDVVLDPVDNQLAYVLIERGGFLGIGGKLVAVPWRNLQATERRDRFVLDVPEDVLKSAPTVDEDNFQQIATENWQQAVDVYWDQSGGAQPEAKP